jgi:NADH-quinone oxidoreductase subunit F
MKIKSLEELHKIKEKGLRKLLPDVPRVAVGLATCGIAADGSETYEKLKETFEKEKIDVYLTKTGCFGICHEEPIVNVRLPGKPLVMFGKVSTDKVNDIIQMVKYGEVTNESALCKIEEWDHVVSASPLVYGKGFAEIPHWDEIPFFSNQKKLVMRNAGIINPEDIEEYIAVGGYSALLKALKEYTPDQVIEEIKKSGLRGRGGAGFPTGLKWEFARKAEGYTKYVICNADEGDPGAYMNRNEMESDPHMVIEGMIIGAYAIGASEGYIYVRAEYPLAIERLDKAISDARAYGLLGNNILGTDFSFDIHIARGAGAFVCGEETALIASMEGNAGRPRKRPPFPAQKGLWGKPTNINNVETWCNIAPIIKNGSEWFARIGTEKSKGTKVFSLVGKVKRTGLVEVPLGTPVKSVVYDIGGGAANDKKVKAVQTGGPSGGCIPASLFDILIDYEHLAEAGSIMGSGGIVVMDEDTCMVDTAKYFLEFAVEESCGKCTPCREGTYQMHRLLNKITEGKGTKEDIVLLEKLGNVIKLTALCGLGQTAPNPVLTTLRYFKDEYIAHVEERKCPARVCRALINYYIDPAACRGCTICARNCPVEAIDGKPGYIHVIDQSKCIKCGTCMEVCNFGAVVKLSGEKIDTPVAPIPVNRGR